jgi:hypothetical protein
MGAAPSRFYGVLCEPKAPGKYPALLSVPGAGVRPYRGLAEMAGHGIITLQVGIHGIPVTMEQSVYDSLGAGALANYTPLDSTTAIATITGVSISAAFAPTTF